jgi:integrase
MSALTASLDDYLSLRRALGQKLVDHERQLTRFVAGLDGAGATFATITDVLAFVLDPAIDPASSVSAHRLTAVRGFVRYLSATDARNQVPPQGLVSYRPSGRIPYLFTDEDVAALVRAVPALTPSAFRAETVATVIVLLAVTGMRVGEALGLDCGDVDWDQAIIKIRATKFGKGRDLVISTSTRNALADYRSHRASRHSTTPRLFVSLTGTRVDYSNFSRTFRRAVTAAGVGAGAATRPHIHDLRHAFAVRSLVNWYHDGLDVEALLPRLSTYLGHREPRYTYRYLTGSPELLAHAAARLDAIQAVPR